MEIKLRKFEESDIEKIENWYINLNEWMEWDAPWEWENYTFNKEKGRVANLFLGLIAGASIASIIFLLFIFVI